MLIEFLDTTPRLAHPREKTSDSDLLREVIGYVTQRLVEADLKVLAMAHN